MKKISVVGVIIVMTLLAGCAMNSDLPKDPDARVAQLKKITQQAESKAIALVPRAEVKEIEQLPTGSFLKCGDGYRWMGGIRAKLENGVDGGETQRALAKSAAHEGYSVTEDKVLTGATRFELVDGKGVQLLVTLYENKTLLNVTSASPCAALPGDYQPPAEL